MSQVYNSALIRSLFDQGHSYIDAFLIFPLNVLSADHNSDLSSIQGNVKSQYAFEIPLHVLNAILKNAKRKGYLLREDKKYRLTENGKQYLATHETEREVERRINALVEDLKIFFNEHGIRLSNDQLLNLLNEFLLSNIGPLVEFINPSAYSELTIVITDDKQGLLAEYMRICETKRPEQYSTLTDMIFGSIISTILYTEEFNEVDELTRSKFKQCDIFLDTNFLISVLGIDDDEAKYAAGELLNTVKSFGFRVRVFDFTIDEISGLLKHYLQEEHRYPKTVNVNSISSKLKRRGLSKSDVTLLISNIETQLNDLDIDIRTGTGVDIQLFMPSDDRVRSKLEEFKSSQVKSSQNHDLAAIEMIQSYRAKTVRKLEHCKAILLTSDTKLGRFNFIGMGHRDKGTMGEVILDRLLSVILWLKNPKAKISLRTVIAVHSKEAFIDKPVWDRFYDVLKELREKKLVSDEDISTLFYNNYIEEALSELSDRETEKITQEFVIEQLEKASNIVKREKEEIIREQKEVIKEKEETFIKQLKETRLEIESKSGSEWFKRVKEIKQSINNHVTESVNIRIRNIKIATVIGFALPLIISAAISNWTALQNTWKVFSVVFVILGVIQFFIPKLWDIFRDKWTESQYLSRIQEADLGED